MPEHSIIGCALYHPPPKKKNAYHWIIYTQGTEVGVWRHLWKNIKVTKDTASRIKLQGRRELCRSWAEVDTRLVNREPGIRGAPRTRALSLALGRAKKTTRMSWEVKGAAWTLFQAMGALRTALLIGAGILYQSWSCNSSEQDCVAVIWCFITYTSSHGHIGFHLKQTKQVTSFTF